MKRTRNIILYIVFVLVAGLLMGGTMSCAVDSAVTQPTTTTPTEPVTEITVMGVKVYELYRDSNDGWPVVVTCLDNGTAVYEKNGGLSTELNDPLCNKEQR